MVVKRLFITHLYVERIFIVFKIQFQIIYMCEQYYDIGTHSNKYGIELLGNRID